MYTYVLYIKFCIKFNSNKTNYVYGWIFVFVEKKIVLGVHWTSSKDEHFIDKEHEKEISLIYLCIAPSLDFNCMPNWQWQVYTLKKELLEQSK